MIAKGKKEAYPEVVIPPSYNVPIGAVSLAAALIFGADNYWAGVPIGLIGVLLGVQAGRVRFLFDGDSMEVKVAKKGEGDADALGDSGQNFAVGGKNRWKYSTFTDWFFIPSKDFPILMYFNEIQTSPKGQLHLFPVIMDGKQLYEVLMERVGSNPPAKTSK
jgi:hypothetical protein